MFSSRRVCLSCLSLILSAAQEGALFAQDTTDRAFLGISTESSSETGGLRITYVFPASAAESMGLRIDDHVLLVNDVRVATPEDLTRELRTENIDAKLRLVVLKDGKRERVSGKLGSYTKTMQKFQDERRKAMIGKPFPAPPSVAWWNVATKSWESKADALEPRAGHVTVVFSFDGCQKCQTQRLGRFATMARVLEQSAGATPVDFRGIYFGEGASSEASRTAAQALFEAVPASFPLGFASYGDSAPTPESRLRNVVLHQHGVAILDTAGNVAYLQIHGVPEAEFYSAFKKVFTAAKPSGSGTTDAEGDGKIR